MQALYLCNATQSGTETEPKSLCGPAFSSSVLHQDAVWYMCLWQCCASFPIQQAGISEECANSVALQCACDAFLLGIFAAVLSFTAKLLLLGEFFSANTLKHVAWPGCAWWHDIMPLHASCKSFESKAY
jgi:hypothetical protein